MQKIITRIPLDDADLRQFYLDGTNSIMKNLPKPSVTIHEKYSYISIKIYIADYLAKGYIPSKIPTTKNKVNKLITDLKFRKSISRRAKYFYRDVSSDNLVVTTTVS